MLFFERQKTLRGEWPTIFSRDSFPQEARTQTWQIFSDYFSHDTAKTIVNGLRFSIGVYMLNNKGVTKNILDMQEHNYEKELNTFFHNGLLNSSEKEKTEYAFTVLEIACMYLDHNKQYEAIDQINYRLRLAGVGYKFVTDQLIPIDDEHITAISVDPVISLLNQHQFGDTYQYFKQAFIDYREGSDKSMESAIDNTVKACEALLKHVLKAKEIEYPSNWTYMRLIQAARDNNLFPQVSDNNIGSLIANLKTLGEIRNKAGGHGENEKNTSDRVVRLAITHAAANILFIAEEFLEN